MVPPGKQRAVIEALDAEGVDYALVDETSNREYAALVSFPLPKEAVEPVLDRLREAGLERDAYTVVLEAETVVSDRFDELAEEYREDADGDRIAREELAARAEDLAPRLETYLLMTVISAIVATAGLLLDSPAVVVGSMVIAPLVGPAMATSVGTVLDDDATFRRGTGLQIAGGVLAVVAAAAFAGLLRVTGIVPLSAAEVFAIGEVNERLAPDMLSVAVALAAGVAGAISLASGVSTALVGVMIAAALVPPTAVVGIGIAFGRPEAIAGAAVLVLVNFLSINVAALATLWQLGYRPADLFSLQDAKLATLRRTGVLVVGLVVLSAFLGALTFASYQTAVFEDEARTTVEEVIAGQPGELRVVSMSVTYDGSPLRRPQTVTVTVGHPPGVDPPRLADALAARIDPLWTGPFPTDYLNGEVSVEVRYVAVDTAGTAAVAGPSAGSVGVHASEPVDSGPLPARTAAGTTRRHVPAG
jgi:uncharacterized hydrophobic protein (TIGR00341 family)